MQGLSKSAETEKTIYDATAGACSLKVLHLISSRGLYGAERVALELCSSLKRRHCEPIIGVIKNVYNPHLEIIEEAKKNFIETVIFPCTAQFDGKLIGSIRTFIRENKVDLIHCHGYKSNFYGLLAGIRRVPLVTTNHNWLTSHWKLRLYRRIDGFLIRFFDRIIAVSEGVKRAMLQYTVPEEKIRVIDNGIDLSRFQDPQPKGAIKQEFGIAEGDVIIGTVGNLGEEKGQIYLLQASKDILRNNRTIKLLIVGEGPLKTSLEQEARQYGIAENVIFTGFRTDIPRLLAIMDIFVLPSVTEGLPMVLLEAMAAKNPVIATRVGAIPNVLNRENGIIVEPKDVNGLRDALALLLSDAEKRQRYAATGYETVRMNYSSDIMCSKYLEVYKEALV
jgi:glycosyltransferase involved in cell wall biosynthesis